MIAGLQTTDSPGRDADMAKTMANLQVASEKLRVKNARGGQGLGRGRGFDMGSITVPDRSLQRQKEPSVTLVFCKLRPSFSLSR